MNRIEGIKDLDSTPYCGIDIMSDDAFNKINDSVDNEDWSRLLWE